MTKNDGADTPTIDGPTLAERTDFYRAWEMVNSAEEYSASVRARAFASWVALFGIVDDGGNVKLNSAEVAKEFSVSRASWMLHRELLSAVGLIHQQPVAGVGHLRKSVRLTPPIHEPPPDTSR